MFKIPEIAYVAYTNLRFGFKRHNMLSAVQSLLDLDSNFSNFNRSNLSPTCKHQMEQTGAYYAIRTLLESILLSSLHVF